MNASEPEVAPIPRLPSDEPNRRRRLLIVDDQPINIQALYQVFAADHQVFMATSGPQALALCLSKQPDLVLLDVMMPGMDGFEVCRRLKADPATADIPVIFVTAHSDEAAETLGLDVGAVDFISKPINPNIVRARVRTHVTLKAQSDLLRHWVYIDGLTGVHNRRYFDERLATEWGRAVRCGTALSVILIDVDFFKPYNDHYGHQTGDDCLRRVASTLKAGLKRPGDLMARYGGEEFACLLPETPLSGALELAHQLGQHVFDQQIAHDASLVAPVVTVSLGVCSKREDTVATVAALVREADAQLYIAKSRGRHQACGAELDQP
ncbi:response regulator receiver modulated diguanylate cyclase [Leptothrix cholodnii SP-6]|uniref:diguanylate cyclase n=1 Tax=Leptothrix cholodnii (strain ATCC 51168 / LMG 8142 / SP-6) TaxID=395495 RepID=B1Y497_LEPCP|nr:diguanylate cyclase [Leptothrix cholodnii]ACB35798.1 response regulator receiver modulated diguanylate cyclase [Leptothrix cholodnii SP-6]